MTENTQNLSGALKEFQEQLQNNDDNSCALIEQRERIRKAPAHKQDVLSRMENIITSMSARYLNTHKNDLQKITSYAEHDSIDLFTKTIKIGESRISLFDADALVFFNQESLLVAARAISKEIALSNAGLPFDERAKKIMDINRQLSELEASKLDLHKQATEAGLVVAEEYVTL